MFDGLWQAVATLVVSGWRDREATRRLLVDIDARPDERNPEYVGIDARRLKVSWVKTPCRYDREIHI